MVAGAPAAASCLIPGTADRDPRGLPAEVSVYKQQTRSYEKVKAVRLEEGGKSFIPLSRVASLAHNLKQEPEIGGTAMVVWGWTQWGTDTIMTYITPFEIIRDAHPIAKGLDLLIGSDNNIEYPVRFPQEEPQQIPTSCGSVDAIPPPLQNLPSRASSDVETQAEESPPYHTINPFDQQSNPLPVSREEGRYRPMMSMGYQDVNIFRNDPYQHQRSMMQYQYSASPGSFAALPSPSFLLVAIPLPAPEPPSKKSTDCSSKQLIPALAIIGAFALAAYAISRQR